MMKILYVEDNPANLFLVQRVARAGGHQVINYVSGEDALQHFDSDDPDLVLMDIQLAGELSGLEVVAQLRRRGHQMPIIAVTAYAMLGDRERAISAGCDDYLSKPMPIARLMALLDKYGGTTAPPTAHETAAAASDPDDISDAETKVLHVSQLHADTEPAPIGERTTEQAPVPFDLDQLEGADATDIGQQETAQMPPLPDDDLDDQDV